MKVTDPADDRIAAPRGRGGAESHASVQVGGRSNAVRFSISPV